jgi:hypothetical protein
MSMDTHILIFMFISLLGSVVCVGMTIRTRIINNRLVDLLVEQCSEMLLLREQLAKFERVGGSE